MPRYWLRITFSTLDWHIMPRVIQWESCNEVHCAENRMMIEKFDMLYKKENTDPKIDFHLLKNGKTKLISTKM